MWSDVSHTTFRSETSWTVTRAECFYLCRQADRQYDECGIGPLYGSRPAGEKTGEVYNTIYTILRLVLCAGTSGGTGDWGLLCFCQKLNTPLPPPPLYSSRTEGGVTWGYGLRISKTGCVEGKKNVRLRFGGMTTFMATYMYVCVQKPLGPSPPLPLPRMTRGRSLS